MAANSSYRAMQSIASQAKPGTIFLPDDFAACGTPDAVRSALCRMCKTGLLKRFSKGIYFIPQIDKWDGSVRQPSLESIAQRIAQRDNARIIPTGTYALNRLGLSTQMPTNIVYITDGSQRQLKFDNGKSIVFRHSNELGNFAYQSNIMQMAVAAMREIGETDLTENQLSKIKEIITTSVDEQDFNHDIVLAPTWVKSLLMR